MKILKANTLSIAILLLGIYLTDALKYVWNDIYTRFSMYIVYNRKRLETTYSSSYMVTG